MTRLLLTMSALVLTGTQISAAADTTTAVIQYVGSVSINPSHETKVLADWYGQFGIQTQEMNGCPNESHPCIGYYGMIQTVAGPFYFGIHPRDPKAPAKSSGSVEVVFRVSDYDSYIANAAKNRIAPDSTEADSTGRFAHFVDPDGNKVTIWGQ